jgi:hypothetical protein
MAISSPNHPGCGIESISTKGEGCAVISTPAETAEWMAQAVTV